jgi:mono/diheme cytochrome c family protein
LIFSKVPKALILFVVLALAGAVVVAGCGGSGGTTSEATTEQEAAPPAEEEQAEEEPAEEAEEEPAEEEPAEEAEEPAEKEEEEAGGESASAGEGKAIFTANCASCHTLKAAGATGTVGPNLDELAPEEAAVENQVINGGGPMPAFGKEGTLSPEEVKAVSAYVATEAGK